MPQEPPSSGLSAAKIDVMLFLRVADLGGAEKSMFKVAHGLSQRGFSVGLAVYGSRCDLVPDAELEGVKIIRLAGLRTFSVCLPLCRLLGRQRPSVLISELTHANIISVIASAVARTGTRVIVTEHGLMFDDKKSVRTKLLRFCACCIYPFADEVVAVSKGLAAVIETLVRRRVKVIYNPVIDEDFVGQAEPPHPWLANKGMPVIMSVGRLCREKNFSHLIRAFARVAKERPARLIVLGEGTERRNLESLIGSLGLTNRVLLPGFTSCVSAWLQYASVFACSSVSEGFGNAIVEAMACGIPVVSTDCPYGPREILEGGRYGRLVPLDDEAAFAAAMEETIDAPLEKEVLKEHAKAFTTIRCLDAYARLINKV